MSFCIKKYGATTSKPSVSQLICMRVLLGDATVSVCKEGILHGASAREKYLYYTRRVNCSFGFDYFGETFRFASMVILSAAAGVVVQS